MFDTYEEAFKTHYTYLKSFIKSPNGISQGYIVYDQFGNPINRVGRISNNPRWYRDFYQKNKRKPTNKDLEVLTREHLQYGFFDEFGFIPPLYPMKR